MPHDYHVQHQVILVRLVWDGRAVDQPIARRFYTLHVDPEPGHPFGRKGLQLASAWRTLAKPNYAGMVILDGDVAIDLHDLAAMLAAVEQEPTVVHVAPVKLWPVSTKQERWIWGHGVDRFSRKDDTDEVNMFGFSFTYLPARLVNACIVAGLARWHYPDVDAKTRTTARALGIRARVVREASPKHLNYL
jgi:hypothetical protein